eukprot:scaffold146473_cov57-Attheya_sp.AAC.1
MAGKKRVNDEAFENMVEGSFRTAQQEEEDDDMDDELAHLAESEETLRQKLDSVAAAPAVMSPRLSSTSLLGEEIDEGGNEGDHDSTEEDAEAITQHQQHGQGEPRSNDRPTGNRDILMSQFSEHQLAELKSLIIEEFKRETDASPPRAQDRDYKDKAVTGAHQSETPVFSSGIDAFSDEEEAQNCVSRENAQADKDEIFEPMKDTFSLMFICNIKSIGFAYSGFFFALQVSILVLIGFNTLTNAPDGNPLNVPVRIGFDVVLAQGLALFVSLIAQSDFMATFVLINVKYDNTVVSLFEEATRTKWIISNICRFFVGVFSIAISFIFIVQSITVIELFFNFAAVQFVSELDNIAFQLAYRGFVLIGDLEQTTRKLISQVQFRQTTKKLAFPCTKIRIPVKWPFLIVHAVILYSAWFVFWSKQATGQYLQSYLKSQGCQSFDVHFGTKVSNLCSKRSCPIGIHVLPYGPFSGIYELYRDNRGTFVFQAGRPVYYQRNIEFGEEDHPGMFSYCKSEKAWVFTINNVTKAERDECNWLLRSPETEAFLLADAPMTGWSIWTNDELVLADPHFELSCEECESDDDCNYNGSCEKNICVCDPSWKGNSCQTYVDCSTLRSEFSFSNPINTHPNEYRANFLHLEGIVYNERPVYYSYTVNEPIEILFYSDGRFNVIEREGFDINPILGVQDHDLTILRDYVDKFYSVMIDSNKVEFYVNGYPDVTNTLTFVSTFTTATTPDSVDVTWRDDWPTNGTTIDFSCLSSYLQYVCQTFQVDFNESIWNELPNGPFSDFYEVSIDRLGTFEWKGNRPLYYQLNKNGGKFSYCESEEAWVFTINGVNGTSSDKCNWLLRSPKTKEYSLGDVPTTEWSFWNEDNTLVSADLVFQLSCGECTLLLRDDCTMSSGNQGIPVAVSGNGFKNAIRSYLKSGKSTYGNKISCWDVSKVTDMTGAFYSLSFFNEPLCGWDVSSVTDMRDMSAFTNLFNQDISSWDVSSVTSMNAMFASASAFDKNISSWDCSSVTFMQFMFESASVFNQDVSSWDVSRVKGMARMFSETNVFNQPISSWDVSSVTNMGHMFHHALVFNQDISSWNVSSVTRMRVMFYGANVFDQDISSWDVSSVTDMGFMFHTADAFDQDISSWDVLSVTDMTNMFMETYAFNQDLCDWEVKTPSLSIVDGMFQSSACPQKGSPTLASPGGTTANPNPGPFCHACTTP